MNWIDDALSRERILQQEDERRNKELSYRYQAKADVIDPVVRRNLLDVAERL